MIHLITNPHTNPDYDTYMTDEEYINQYLSETNGKLISTYYKAGPAGKWDELWFVVEITNKN